MIVVDRETKMLIVVRTDLKMSVGKKIVQACHAAISTSELAKIKTPNTWMKWFREGQKKVALKIKSEAELIALYENVKVKGIPCELIRDAGLTQIAPGSITALGIGPVKNTDIDDLTGELKLF